VAARDWLNTALLKYQASQPEGMDESEYFQQFNGYDLTATAFNTGVFAFNTEIIDNTTQAGLQKILRKFQYLARFPEQLWMNLYFYQKWERLPTEYNLFAYYLHVKRKLPKDRIDGVVLHFPRYANEEASRCWDGSNAFYDEWKKNLERAELIDLEKIPEAKNQWPGLKHLLFQKWRVRLALLGDYLIFCRDKIAMRSRIRRVMSAVRPAVVNLGNSCQ
jgi:lipopolysaccharide biosynthesis glycosyltransferase